MKPATRGILAAATVFVAGAGLAVATAQPFRVPESDPPTLLQEFFRQPPAVRPSTANPHPAGFLQLHGETSPAADAPCVQCHAETFCTDCHAGLVAPLDVHPAGYMTLHGPDALTRSQDCAGCHAPDRFCAQCHQAVDIFAQVGQPVGSPHGPEWMDAASPFNHASECRANIASCMSCHSSESCASCHSFVNPHGPDMRERCGALLNSGTPVCADCHNDNAVLSLPMLRALPGCQ
jgi:hypothetical protein